MKIQIGISLLIILLFSCKQPEARGKMSFTLQPNNTEQLNESFIDYQQKLIARLTEYGFDKNDITIQSQNNQIVVDIKQWSNYKVKTDLLVIRQLLQAKGELCFQETYSLREMMPFMQFPDSVSPEKRMQFLRQIGSPLEISGGDPMQEFDVNRPEFSFATVNDTSAINRICDSLLRQPNYPKNLVFCWTKFPARENKLALILLRSSSDSLNRLKAKVIDAKLQEQGTNRESIGITLATNDAEKFRMMTSKNIGQTIAFLVDEQVYSYPTVQSEIPGGRLSMSGAFNAQQKQLAILLIRSPFQSPLTIVQQTEEN
jgi:hypothetical protein